MIAKSLRWTFRIILLTLLYIPIWIIGTLPIQGLIPDNIPEPGPVSDLAGIIILSLLNTSLIVGIIMTSRWQRLRLLLATAIAYYCSFTLLTQIETWYFLTEITVQPRLLVRLFLMGLPIPFLFIPLTILICKRWKNEEYNGTSNLQTSIAPLLIKASILAVIYLILYWTAGYFIAWQSPELREFYGRPGAITPFFEHTYQTFTDSPSLIVLQLFRGVLFVAIALPIVLGSRLNPKLTALLVAFLFAAPHLVHIMPNPLMPSAQVRLSHMIETVTSTFLYGLIVVYTLYVNRKTAKVN